MAKAMSSGSMTTTPMGAIFFLGSAHRLALLPFMWRAIPRCKTLTFWSDDGGVAFLLGGVVLEARACQSVLTASIMA